MSGSIKAVVTVDTNMNKKLMEQWVPSRPLDVKLELLAALAHDIIATSTYEELIQTGLSQEAASAIAEIDDAYGAAYTERQYLDVRSAIGVWMEVVG